jgi:hypothetical protein
MTHLPSFARPLGFAAFAATAFLFAPPAMSEPLRVRDRVCSAAYESARQFEGVGHLLQAKEQLLKCANSACSGWIRQQCSSRYIQLEEDTPTVVPLATDELGIVRVDVQVTVDGEPLTSHLDGRSLPIDPGLHEFSFTADGVATKTKVMIVQGARNRPVAVTLSEQKGVVASGSSDSVAAKQAPSIAAADKRSQPVEPPATSAKHSLLSEPPVAATPVTATPVHEAGETDAATADVPRAPKPKSGPGAAPYIIGSVGLAGVGAFGLLTYWGRMDNQQLGQCAPYCSAASVDHIRKLYLAADVSLGVGIAGLGVATTWLLMNGGSAKKERAPSTLALDVAPTPSGGVATVSGSF